MICIPSFNAPWFDKKKNVNNSYVDIYPTVMKLGLVLSIYEGLIMEAYWHWVILLGFFSWVCSLMEG